jgi:teichuronic acid biosynthesis glycosyltransferase TuaG
MHQTEAESATVSVIIATWNRAHTLRAAIFSALSQKPAPLEVLVCDDGSTDESRTLVAQLADRRVRWVSGPHRGRPAVARNRGMRVSRGEWIAFLDSNDQWLPGKLRAELTLARRLSCLASCSNASRIVPGMGPRGNLLPPHDQRLTFRQLLADNSVICSSALFHCSLIRKVRGFPEDAALVALEDHALWLRVASFTDFAFVDDPLVAYTDDPEASVMQRETDVATQRDRIFRSYLAWAPPVSRNVIALRMQMAREAAHARRRRLAARFYPA